MERGILSFFALALVAVMVYTFSYKSWLRISYELHKVEITELFCINKEETAFNCEGQCYLHKSLEKADLPGKDNHNEERTSQIQLQLFVESELNTSLNIPFFEERLKDSYSNLYTYLSSTSLLQPPRKNSVA